MSSTLYPIDGYGGLLYHVQFQAPVYNTSADETYSTISWYNIDVYYRSNAMLIMVAGMGLAICSVTLLNIIAITPPQKRRLPVQIYMMLSLLFYMIADIIFILLLLHSPLVSAYISLTLDTVSITYTTTYVAMMWTLAVATCLGLIFVQFCLFFRGSTMLVWLQIHHNYAYRIVTSILCLASIIDVCIVAAILILQVLSADKSTPLSEVLLPIATVQLWTSIVSIGGWSIVFFISAIRILFQRRRLILARSSQNTLYDSALTLISITGLESFIIPIILTILKLTTSYSTASAAEAQLDRLIPRIVLFLLTLSSLFNSTTTAFKNGDDSDGQNAITRPAARGNAQRHQPTDTQKEHRSASDGGDKSDEMKAEEEVEANLHTVNGYMSLPTTSKVTNSMASAIELYSPLPIMHPFPSAAHAPGTKPA